MFLLFSVFVKHYFKNDKCRHFFPGQILYFRPFLITQVPTKVDFYWNDQEKYEDKKIMYIEEWK